MKYEIDFNGIKIRDELENNISLFVKENNQILYLNSFINEILKNSKNGINDTKEIFDIISSQNSEVIDLETVELSIYQLESFNVCKIIENDIDMVGDGITVGGEHSYREISKFIIDNYNNKFSFIPYGNKDYYSLFYVRERQFNNYEFNFIKYKNNKIAAIVVIGIPPSGSRCSVLQLNAFITSANNKQETICLSQELLEYIKNEYVDDYNKLRIYTNDLINTSGAKLLIEENNFKLVAELEGEIDKIYDVKMYDMMI